MIDKTKAAVQDRLTKEINYWDHRAAQLKDQELAGKVNAKLNSGLGPAAGRRPDRPASKTACRTGARAKTLRACRPSCLAGAMIVPIGLLRKLQGETAAPPPDFAHRHRTIRTPGDGGRHGRRAPTRIPAPRRERPESRLRHRVFHSRHRAVCDSSKSKAGSRGAKTVTITKNEILTGLNKPDEFILAIVLLDPDRADVRYVRRPFEKEPDFKATSVNYDLDKLLAISEVPLP